MYMQAPLVLAYEVPEETLLQLGRIGKEMNIAVRAVPEEEYAAPIGLAAGAKNWRNPLLAGTHGMKESGPLTEPLLVMAGFDEKLLDRFLSRLRRERLELPLKAVLTPDNANWNARDLFAHIVQERSEYLAQLRKGATD